MSSAVLSVVFVIALVAFFVYAARAGEKMQVQQRARLSRARPARARVLGARQGTSAIRRSGRRGPEVVLSLDIEGRGVEARWYVFELGFARIQEGMIVDVRIDAEDPRIVYPNAEWAEHTSMPHLAAG